MPRSRVWLAVGVIVCALTAGPAHALQDLGHYVFVSSRATPDVVVIDTVTDEVAARNHLPGMPRQTVISSAARKLIATDRAANRLYLVDLASLRTEQIVDTGFPPALLQLDSKGTVLAAGDSESGRLVLMSLDDRRGRSVEGPRNLSYIAFDRLGWRLFAASRTSSAVSVIDVASASVAGEMRPEDRRGIPAVTGVAFFGTDPGGQYGFAAHGDSGVVSVFELATLRHIASVVLPGPARRVFSTADSQRVFVPNENDGSISIISTWTFKETARLPAPSEVTGINFGFLQTVAFAISRRQNKAVAYDLNRKQPARGRDIPLPGQPETGMISADGLKLYIALSDTGQVAVVDVRSFRLVRLIENVAPQVWAITSGYSDGYCH